MKNMEKIVNELHNLDLPKSVNLFKKNLALNNLLPDKMIKTNIIHALYMREFYMDYYFQIVSENDYIIMNDTPASIFLPLEFINEVKPTQGEIENAEKVFKFSSDPIYFNYQKSIFKKIKTILN